MESESDSDENNTRAAVEKREEELNNTTFEALGVCEELCEACVGLKWSKPTEVQAASIPHLIKGTPHAS
jgi:superfamily II DNA/RNA helicase